MDTLPDDIIKYIMLKTDIKYLNSLCDTCKRFKQFNRNILLENINTELDINNYTLKQLRILYENIKFGTKRIITEYARTFIVKDNGEVCTMGIIDDKSGSHPRIIKNIKDVIKVDTNGCCEIYLTKDGKVYISGSMEDIFNIDELYLLPDINNAIDISVGNNYILILLSNGKVMGFGSNDCNQLGIINRDIVLNPILIPILENIVNIQASGHTSYFLSKEGTVYRSCSMAGLLKFIDLDNVKRMFPAQNSDIIVSKINNGKLDLQMFWIRKNITIEHSKMEINFNMIDVSAFENSILYLDNNGDVYVTYDGMGRVFSNYATVKQIKIKGLKNIISIYGNDDGWFFVDINKNLYVMGLNYQNELGLEYPNEITEPIISMKL